MRSEKEIKEMLEKLQKDEKLSYPTANVFENAPLAMIQLTLKTQIGLLKWILNCE